MVRVVTLVKGASAGLGNIESNENNFITRAKIQPINEPQEILWEFDKLEEVKKLVASTWGKDQAAQVQVLDFAVRQFG